MPTMSRPPERTLIDMAPRFRAFCAALVLTPVAVLASACTPLWEGGLALTRTADGTLVAVIYSCEEQKVRVSIMQNPSETPSGTAAPPAPEVLFQLQAKVSAGATVVPLTASPPEPWHVRSGTPVTAAEAASRSLFVHVMNTGSSVGLGNEYVKAGRLPVLDDGQPPAKVSVDSGATTVDRATFERDSTATCRR